jgi:hypothetical protein
VIWEQIEGYYDWGVFYEDVVRDYGGGTLVEVGCYLAGDDYGIKDEPPVWPGVRRAVDELLPQRKLVPHDAWAFRKR